MTTGNKLSDRMETDGVLMQKIWSGQDDALNKKAENAYSMKIIERQHNLLTQQYVSKTTGPYGYLYYSDYRGYDADDSQKPLWENNSEIALLSKATQALRQHSFNAGIFGAEFGKALNSVVTSAASVLLAYKQVRQGNLSLAMKTIARATAGTGVKRGNNSTTGMYYSNSSKMHHSEIAQAHLAATYAWMPLLQDIQESMLWIESKTKEPRELQTVVRKTQTDARVDYSWVIGANYPFWETERVRAELRIHMVETISTARSLGLLNPLTVAWEVVPFSFVVDWLIPIGTYLDEIGFLSGLELYYGRSMKSERFGWKPLTRCSDASWPMAYPQWPHLAHCHPDFVNDPLQGGYATHTGGGSFHRVMWLDRTVGTSLNVPTPRPKDLEKALSIPHIKNAAALIWTGISDAKASESAQIQAPLRQNVRWGKMK